MQLLFSLPKNLIESEPSGLGFGFTYFENLRGTSEPAVQCPLPATVGGDLAHGGSQLEGGG